MSYPDDFGQQRVRRESRVLWTVFVIIAAGTLFLPLSLTLWKLFVQWAAGGC